MSPRTGMGAQRSLWEKLALPEADAFREFEDGVQVPIESVIPSDASRRAGLTIDGPGTLPCAAFDGDAWSFPGPALLESGRARLGTRVASDEPHILELGALGIPSFFATPLVLSDIARERCAPLGAPRRVVVRVNGPLAPGTGPVDIALAVARETGIEGLSGAILEYQGDAVDGLPPPARRILCGASALTGCLAAFTPLDERLFVYAASHGLNASVTVADVHKYESDPGAPYHELVIINGDALAPLAADPRRGIVRPAADERGKALRRVVAGGCLGGDLESLEEWSILLDEAPPRAGIELLLVAGSARIAALARDSGLAGRLAERGARLVRPADLLSASDGLSLATSPCLVPGALLAGAATLAASAHEGRIATEGSA